MSRHLCHAAFFWSMPRCSFIQLCSHLVLSWQVGHSPEKWPWTLTLTYQKLALTSGAAAKHSCHSAWKSDKLHVADEQTRLITIPPGGGNKLYCQTNTTWSNALTKAVSWNKTKWWYNRTRNTLDCDQSNYSSRIIFSHIPLNLVKRELAPIDPPTPKTPS